MAERGPEIARRLDEARAGSPEALGRALEAFRGYLLRIAEQELDPDLRAKGGASDLVQETFLKAHRHFDRFHGDSEAELRAWLRQLLRNQLADFRALFREAGKRRLSREVGLDAGSRAGPADAGPSPSGVAIGHEEADALRRALGRLPEDYRRVLVLRHQEGQTFEEIGRQMGRSAEAVRKLWARAVERLQQQWEDAP